MFPPPSVEQRLARFEQAASKAFAQGDYPAAAAKWHEALTLARRQDRERHAARILIQLSKAHENRGLYDSARAYAESGLLHAQSLAEEGLEAEARIALGTTWLRQGEYPKAREQLEQALAIARRRRDRGLESESLRHLGAVAQNIGDYAQALSYYSGALESARASGDGIREAKALNNLGGLYRLRGEYQAALLHYQHSLALRRRFDDRPGEGRVLGNLCLTYLRLADDAKALDHCSGALDIARRTGDRAREANQLNTLGALYRRQGALNRALSHYRRSLAIKEALSDRAGAGRSLNNIAELYWQTDRYPQALDYYSRSLALREAIGDRPGESAVYHNMALLHLEQGRYDEALDHFEQALAIQNEIGDSELLWRILDGLARSYEDLGRPRLAIFFGKHAVNTLQSMRAAIAGLDKGLQSGFLEDKIRVYRQLADRLIDQGRLLEARQILAMLKQEEYFDYVRGETDGDAPSVAAVFSGNETPWMERYREISEDLVRLGLDYSALKRRGFSGPPLSQEEAERLAQLEEDLKTARLAFFHFLDELRETFLAESGARADEFGERDFKSLVGFDGILRRLGPGVVLVHYLILDDKLRIILTGADPAMPPVHIDSAIGRKTLYRLIYDYRTKLGNPRLSPFPEAQTLHGHLIDPIEENLELYGAKILMMYLDGALRYLPFSALHDGSQYLAERYAVVMYTVAAKGNLLLAPGEDWRVAGLGLSVEAAGFKALPAVVDELNAIVKESETDSLGVLPGQAYLNNGFTAERLQAVLYEGYPVVHLATHFNFQPGPTKNSFLLLGDGNPFDLETFKVGDYPLTSVELLTLSACETALGSEDADGRELEGFGTLAQNQGAAAVLATLWKVADRSTARFMERFYTLKQNRHSKAAALRQAQLAFIHGETGGETGDGEGERGVGIAADIDDGGYQPPPETPYAHPFYWAPFVLMGNWL